MYTKENPPTISEFFDQTDVWCTAGGWIPIADMTDDHRHNSATFLLKRSAFFFGLGNHHITMVDTPLWRALAAGGKDDVQLRPDHVNVGDVRQVFYLIHLESIEVWESRQAER